MLDKDFKTIDDQLKILRSRGLNIKNEEKCKTFLLHNNYYRISGYSLTLRKNDVFFKNATFQNIIDIYEFDRELRNLLLGFIEIIEVKFKSIFAYELTKTYGSIGYLNSDLFTIQNKHSEIIAKAEAQKNTRLRHEAYLKHFVGDLKQPVPFWAYVDLLTISDISFLYKISDETIKKSVAIHLGLKMSKNEKILGQFMHSMTIIRNLCAHGSRLYNRLFEQKPSLNSRELSLLRVMKDGTVDNAHLFGFILIMKRLLSNEDFVFLKNGILNIQKKYPFVSMNYYGFRDDWQTTL
ncbi:MAG: Abi family protein [Niameybacter sp.]